mmetsp:Transcript_32275/g.60779  ORF Transcript_32275/g.60779 Transcript_32275/m.60779 type:complete len:115 (+) Transcript_32275:70-414(+)
MVLTMLGRTAARCGALGRVGKQVTLPASSLVNAGRSISSSRQLLASGYDWNLGVPGSRIRNPDPAAYNDVAPSMGFWWWALIVSSVSSFFWGYTYDHSRGITVAAGLFGPNMPL